jgi:hypothetical protein
MDTAPSTPDADVIYALYKGDYKTQLVRLALRLEVFAPLAAGPADAETVARACSCVVKEMRALLEYLHSIHLLIKEGNTYALTPTTATCLMPGKPSYAGELLLLETDPQLWEGVLQALRSGRPVRPSVPWEQDAWLESYRTWRPAQSIEMWRAVGIEPVHRSGLRVLDVACGCAIKSFVLAQADPTVHITCLDRAEVLEVARALAERPNLLSQVTFLPADLHAVQFGEDQYDAVLFGQITHHLTPAQNQ